MDTAALIMENHRLRSMLALQQRNIEDLTPGRYIVTSDGDWNGGQYNTLQELRNLLPDYAENCTAVLVEVHEVRHPEPVEDLDAYNGVTPGIDFSMTLHR